MLRTFLSVGLSAGLFLIASGARAHTSLEQAGTHLSRYGDAEIKVGPCGRANGTRGTNVYTYAPGETITVTVKEYVSHSGYYRIAFDDDGDDDFADPASIEPENGRTCTANPDDHCGAADYFNNATVLMDHLNPHAQAIFTTPTYTWEVTLPNVECDNCTLQIIQVMTENGKAPYNPSAPGENDIYYTCIDLVLQGAGGTGATGGTTSTGGLGGTMAVGGTGGTGGTAAPAAGTGGTGTVPSQPADPVAGFGAGAGAGTGVAAAGGTAAPTPMPVPTTSTGGGDGGGCALRGAPPAAASSWSLALALLFLTRRRR